MPQLPQPTTIRDHLDALTREASALAHRLSVLTQELEWLSDAVDARQIPSMEQEAA